MRRFVAFTATPVLAAASGLAVLVGTAASASAAPCVTVVTSKGAMTAALVDPVAVTAPVDATGCDIGVYYDSAGSGSSLDDATVENATKYGVWVDGGKGDVSVDITDSTISNIGDKAVQGHFTGSQHGIGVYYYGYQTVGSVSGTVDSNTVTQYQKGGIVVNGAKASVATTSNTVTGLGPVGFIAQNGIQFGFGASGSVTSNAISGNDYTGCSNQDAAKTGCTPWVSTGLLLYDIDPPTVNVAHNQYRDNQRNLYMAP